MWRSVSKRKDSARRRLALARALWGWRPHAGQREFLSSTAQVRVAACGRRWGKTEALSVDLATLALDEAHGGRDCRQLVVAPTEAQARLIGGETLARLRAAFDAGTAWTEGLDCAVRQRPALQITLHPRGADPPAPDGKKAQADGPALSQILFRTAGRDGRGLRGLWAHRIVCDEAGYIPDPVLDEVLLPMLADVGGELILASSPAGRRSAYFRCFARGSTGCPEGEASPHAKGPHAKGPHADRHGVTYESFQCPSTDNTHLDKAWLAALREDLGESRYAQEVAAQFVDDYGAVFRADDIDGCLAEDAAVSLVEGDLVSAPVAGHAYAVGIDWGRKRDFTVVSVLDATGAPARLVGLWRMQGMGYTAQAARVGALVSLFRPRRVLADGNSIGDAVADQLQQEIADRCRDDGDRVPQVERFLFGAESKTRLVDHLTLGLSARALTYPYHRVLLRELRGFEYGGATAGGRHRMAAKGGGHDDTVMALALAWYGAPDGPPPSPSRLLLLASHLGIGRRGED